MIFMLTGTALEISFLAVSSSIPEWMNIAAVVASGFCFVYAIIRLIISIWKGDH